jgi:predicted nucleic acid-binding protein
MLNRLRPLGVYIDSNVAFTATFAERHRFRGFWEMSDVMPAISRYGIDEVRRNIVSAQQRERFEALLDKTLIVSDWPPEMVPETVVLVAKDRPILAAAIYASMDYLVTGDKHHFGDLYGKTVGNVTIMSPGLFLDRHADRARL